MLILDGREGEGGGQILRTSLSLSALTGRPFRLEHIRAQRSRPGLRPQHLTAVRAVARICSARLVGDALNATTLEFHPQHPPHAGSYHFDVNQAAAGQSAGSVALILGALLWPLLFAGDASHLVLRGGTHVPFSPPYHYLAQVALPAFARLGARASVALPQWGWMPKGGGEVTAVIEPLTQLEAASWTQPPGKEVAGLAAAANLPAHIPQRMVDRAARLLAGAGLRPHLEPLRVGGPGTGAAIFLWQPGAGFGCLGRKGWPSEQVAETAVADLLAFHEAGAAVDEHLADQLLMPLALAHGRAAFTTHRLTQHTITNASLLRQWLDVPITLDGEEGGPAQIMVTGAGFSR